MIRTRSRIAILGGALALVLAACPADEPVAVDDPEPDEAEATIEITSPQPGDDLEAPFDVEFTVTGVEIGEIEDGHHHLHVYVADREFDPHYSTDPYTVSGVGEGEVDIRIEIARPNHDEIGVSDSVSVSVTNGGPVDEEEEQAPGPY
jgi:hypothetical protein